MRYTFRALQPGADSTDHWIFEKMAELQGYFPKWYQDTSGLSKKLYIKRCEKAYRVYAIFDEEIVKGVLVGETGPTPGTLEVHVCCDPQLNKVELVRIMSRCVDILFAEGLDLIYAWIVKQHRGLRQICEAVGFKHYGFVMYQGTVRNRPAEWLNIVITEDLRQSGRFKPGAIATEVREVSAHGN